MYVTTVGCGLWSQCGLCVGPQAQPPTWRSDLAASLGPGRWQKPWLSPRRKEITSKTRNIRSVAFLTQPHKSKLRGLTQGLYSGNHDVSILGLSLKLIGTIFKLPLGFLGTGVNIKSSSSRSSLCSIDGLCALSVCHRQNLEKSWKTL